MLERFGIEPSNSNELGTEPTWVQQIQAVENAPRDVQEELVKLMLPDMTASISALYSNVQELRESLFIIAGLTLSRGEILKKALEGVTGKLFKELVDVQESYTLLRRKAGVKDYDDLQPKIDAYTELVKQVTTGIQLLIQGEDHGEALRSTAAVIVPRLAELHQRAKDSSGGKPKDPHLDYLYELALPYYAREQKKWSWIVQQVWKQLKLKPYGELSKEERTVFLMWENSTHIERKRQIIYVFSSREM